MKIMLLAAFFMLSLAGCVGQNNEQQQGLVFSVTEATFTLTPECTQRAEVDHDEEGRPMLVVSMKQSPECSEKASETVFSQEGQYLTVKYDKRVIVDRELIVTPMDPTSPTWLGVGSEELAREIEKALN